MFELVLDAIGNDTTHPSINEDMFVQIIRNYLVANNHKWNDTFEGKVK